MFVANGTEVLAAIGHFDGEYPQPGDDRVARCRHQRVARWFENFPYGYSVKKYNQNNK